MPLVAYSAGKRVAEPKEFDRLDGTGPSGKKVNVIEWENNLEIHVYPKGSLSGLGLKVDRKDKNKPVMVIEYSFKGTPYTIIRRAVIAVPLKDGFRTYQESNTDDYDKVIITNHTLTASVKPFPLNAAPTQLYPDHHPALQVAEQSDDAAAPVVGESRPETYSARSSQDTRIKLEKANEDRKPASQTQPRTSDEGSVGSFDFK